MLQTSSYSLLNWLSCLPFSGVLTIRLDKKRKEPHESKKLNTPTKKSLLEFFSDSTHFLPAFWYDGLFSCVLFIWFVFSISDKLEL